MNDYKLIFCILKILKDYDDKGCWHPELLTKEALKTTIRKLNVTVNRLADEGLIEGASFDEYIGSYEPELDNSQPFTITLKGIEFLAENNSVRKAGDEILKWSCSIAGQTLPVVLRAIISK